MKSLEFITEASIFDERTLKNTQWKSPKQTIRWLLKNRFKPIGTGWFSAVFAKSGHNRVVKISTQADHCWIAFAQYAQSKTNNPHLPHIPWIKRYQGEREGIPQEFFITIIERLTPLTDQAISRITDPGVLLGLIHYADLDSSTEESIDAAISKVGNSYNAGGTREFYRPDALIKYKNHPFIKAIIAINNLPGGCVKDLHSGNLMVRKDGTVVIIDPLAYL